MALPILDGNQTATTLATTVSGGAHYPNHILASAVTIGSLPAISGMVTASNILYKSGEWIFTENQYFQREAYQYWRGGSIGNDIFTITYDTNLSKFVCDLGGNQKGKQGQFYSQSINGPDETMLPPDGNWYDSDGPNGGNYITIEYKSPFTSRVIVSNAVTVGSLPAISGTVTASVANSITVGSLPVQLSTTTIGGTSRLNVTLSSATTVGATAPSYGNLSGGSDGTNFRAILTDTSGRTVVTVSNFPSTQPVSLASLPSLAAGTAQIGSVTASISGTSTVTMGAITGSVSILGTSTVTFTAITGSTTILGTPSVTFSAITGSVNLLGTPSVTMGAISGTVTANVSSTTVTVSALPSGALTTRFGSVTTANTSQLTAAVTNGSRKYLIAQNISAGTVTIGIGFSPTTTQGIQLTAGAGITFDSFCPTGAVWWLGATTGATWTILEG